MTAKSASAKTWSARRWLRVVNDGACRPMVRCRTGSSALMTANMRAAQSAPAASSGGRAKLSGSLPRFQAHTPGWSFRRPTTSRSCSSAASIASGSVKGLRYGPASSMAPLTTWRPAGTGSSPPSSHDGAQLGPLMWPVKKVTSRPRPRSAATSHTTCSWSSASAATVSGVGWKSSHMRNTRTRRMPRPAMTSNSSATSSRSKSFHQYMALRRGQ